MSNLKRYPEYKDSGVPWLGEIPSHWEKKSLKFCLSIPITDGPHETPEILDKGIPFISAEAVKNDKLDFNKKRGYISEQDHRKFSKKYTPQRGDVYMVKSGATTGNVARVQTDKVFSIWSPLAVIRPNTKLLLTDFIFYTLKSSYFNTSVQLMWNMGTQQNIGMGILSNIDVVLPGVQEQQAIVDFLDSRLNHIDTLISKQERLLDKLAEQRKAVITHAVTKGLDPKVPMKDSGVECLDEIPEHWYLTTNKYLFNFSRGLTITKSNLTDVGIPCINYGEVHSKYGFEVDPTIHPLKCVPENYAEDFKYAVLNQGDFVFADTSEDYEGSGNFTHLSSDVLAMAGYHTVVMKQKGDQNYRFLAYMFDSKVYRSQIKTKVSGVKVFSITQNILKNTLVWLPPRTEQDKIVEYLDNEVGRVDQLHVSTQKIIVKLKEYRSALITQAVTGKIDVRGLAEETKGIA